jgi:hypothetical protein
MCNSRKKILLHVTCALLRCCWELNTDGPIFEVLSFVCPRQQINRLSDSNQILPSTFSSDWILNMTRLHKYRSVVMDFTNIRTVRLTLQMGAWMNLCPSVTELFSHLTSVGPRIVIYFYSTTNQMHNIINLFYFVVALYMFQTVSPSIIRSLRLYIQHQVHVIQVFWSLGNKQSQYLYGMMLYVQS